MKLSHYAKRYITLSPGVKRHRKYKLIDFLLKDHMKVLDIGCASGLFYDNRKHKHIEYHGVDYNDAMIDHCSKKGLHVKQCDISKGNIPYEDNSFDFIYCSHVIEHLLANEQIQLFSEIQRVLKKDGILLLFSPTPYHWYFRDDPTHQRACTHGSLEHLSKDFDMKVIEAKYSYLRFFPQSLQKWLRLPPLRWLLWEVYLVAKK